MGDGSLHPTEAAELIRQLNAGGAGKAGGRPLYAADPLPPMPKLTFNESDEPPLPDDILAELGGAPVGAPAPPAEKPEVAKSDREVAWTPPSRPASPSGVDFPTALALQVKSGIEGVLITTEGEVSLTPAEQKALLQLCGRVLERRMKETLTAVRSRYGKPK